MRGSSSGHTFVETVIGLALLGIALPALLGGTLHIINFVNDIRDRAVLLELAEMQTESLQQQPFKDNPTQYTLISAPVGYTVTLTATTPPVTYYYPAPSGLATPLTLQALTITSTGLTGDLSVETYKVGP